MLSIRLLYKKENFEYSSCCSLYIHICIKTSVIHSQILKDITLRNKVITGRRVHYVPGWDCHGLPIEQKVLNDVKDVNPLQIRQKGTLTDISEISHQLRITFILPENSCIVARKYASKTMAKQKQVFMSWGLMADWSESGCYFTDDTLYTKNQLEQFINLYQKELIFRAFMPVHWSPSSK